MYYLGYYICGIIILFAFIVSLIVQAKVNRTYERFKDEESSIDLTGGELAQKLAFENGVNVTVQSCKGKLFSSHNDFSLQFPYSF